MKKQVGKLNPLSRKPEPPPIEKATKGNKKAKKKEVRKEKKEATTVITKKQRLEQNIEQTLKQTDYDERNALHRACLEQQANQIKEIFEEIIAQKKPELLPEYIVKKDKFNCEPLLLCCIKQKPNEQSNTRLECLQLLLKPNPENPFIKANINCINPRTLWSCLHWVSYYGDEQSVKFLLENGIHVFLPDYKGQYPIDLAGRNRYEVVVDMLIKQSIKLLEQYYLQVKAQQYIVYFRGLSPQEIKHLENPLYLCRLIYWSALFKIECRNSPLLMFRRSYFFFPFQQLKNKTALHAACHSQNGNLDFLNEAFNKIETQLIGFTNILEFDKVIIQNKQTYSANNVFNFTPGDLETYRDEFKKEILFFANWEKQFIEKFKLVKTNKLSYKDFYSFYVNQQDSVGNSALHIASIKAFKDGINILLSKSADMELENNELFKARELTQDPEVTEIYNFKMQETTSDQILNDLNQTIIQSLMVLFKKDQYDEQLILRNNLSKISSSTPKTYYKMLEKLNLYSLDLFVPDFIIRAKINANDLDQTTLSYSPVFFDLKTRDSPDMIRLNFYISLLQSANFEVFLMKSQFEQGFYYIMLRHTESNLEEQADIMNLQIKLMDSYDLEEFEKKFQSLYEPFRSRQRQQIIEQHLMKIKDLNEQINAKIIETFYRMHKSGGINTIKDKWLIKDKWYFPTPINQISEYLKEGENQNFNSITILRLYFGEKISFYFAWKSYITCAMLALAVPGAAIQIYILATGDNFPAILPFWVCYVCLWSTLQVEFWKRKTSEITTRWGCLDLLDSKDRSEVRRGFQGYEEIYQVTGELTKHQKKKETFLKVFLSVLVVLIFLTICVLIFVGVNYLVNRYQGQIIITTALNIIQGIGIFILNLVYNMVVMFFAQYENHKYEEDYEQSIIYKNSAFTFINSYLCIFYAAFYNNKSFMELFIQLVPVLIVKQVQYSALKVLLPQVKYKYFETQYFKRQQDNIQRQSQMNREGFKDKIEILYESIFKEKKYTIQTCKRAVLKIGEKGEPPKLEQNIDADQVELNNLKLNFEGTLGYFMEGIIDLGYITLFAAAFPIGPAIAVIANVAEIRMKLLSFIEVYKRPQCQRCAGIGNWVNIMQMMGIGSVFSNFALLYVRYKEDTVSVIYGYNGTNKNIIIWLFFLTIAIILIIKLAFQWLIPDKPQWVLNELSKIQEKQHVNTGQREALKKMKVVLSEKEEKRNLLKIKNSEKKSQYDGQIEIKKNNKSMQENQIERYQKQEEKEKLLALNDASKLQNLSELRVDKTQYPQLRLGLLTQKYIEIQHYLLQKRIRQIDLARMKNIFLCQNCSLVVAIFECETCDEVQCYDCFQKVHTKIKGFDHEVMLLKSAKYYDPELLKKLQVKRKVKQPALEQLQCQVVATNIEYHPRKWQKIQNFCFPILRQSASYSALTKVFKHLYREYTDNIELNEIELSKLYRFRKENDKFIFYDSENIVEILKMDELNLEEKIWLNRIGFLCSKKGEKFDFFYNCTKTLQTGSLDQKIELLVEFADLDGDGELSKQEIEDIFITSLVQDSEGELSISKMINDIFSEEQTISKQQAIKLLSTSKDQQLIKALIQLD